MEALQMFFYATVGLAALIFVVGHAKTSVKNATRQWKGRKALLLRKRFHEAFESVQPTVDLWWEEQGRKELRVDNNLLELMPEQLRTIAETQHRNAVKQAATQLAGGLVLKSGAKLSAMELTAVNNEIEELRQQLLDNGIDMDAFEKLFA